LNDFIHNLSVSTRASAGLRRSQFLAEVNPSLDGKLGMWPSVLPPKCCSKLIAWQLVEAYCQGNFGRNNCNR
jgi:hypothetical protein